MEMEDDFLQYPLAYVFAFTGHEGKNTQISCLLEFLYAKHIPISDRFYYHFYFKHHSSFHFFSLGYWKKGGIAKEIIIYLVRGEEKKIFLSREENRLSFGSDE